MPDLVVVPTTSPRPSFSFPVVTGRRHTISPPPSVYLTPHSIKPPTKPIKSPSTALDRLRRVAIDLNPTNHGIPPQPTLTQIGHPDARKHLVIWETLIWLRVNMIYEPLLTLRQEAEDALRAKRLELGFDRDGGGMWDLGDGGEYQFWEAELNGYERLWETLRAEDEAWLVYRVHVRARNRMGLTTGDVVDHSKGTHRYRPPFPPDLPLLLSVSAKVRPEHEPKKQVVDGSSVGNLDDGASSNLL